jgi:uncharacterized protein YbjT (DUF2867 family)
MRIGVYPAAGNVGRHVVAGLLSTEHEVVPLVRTLPANLPLPAGIEAKQVVIPDSSTLIEATRGLDALFWLTPPAFNVDSIARWYADSTTCVKLAVTENEIRRVVHVSSLGAGTVRSGTVTYVGDVEKSLNSVVPNVVHLRPGYFMQNLLANAADLAHRSVLALPYSRDHDIPWISVRDIAAAAVRYLCDGTWTGQWYVNLMGARNYTGEELAKILGDFLRRPVAYEQVSVERQCAVLAAAGLAEPIVSEMAELFVALGDPDGVYATARTHDAATATDFASFVAQELLPKIREAEVSAEHENNNALPR